MLCFSVRLEGINSFQSVKVSELPNSTIPTHLGSLADILLKSFSRTQFLQDNFTCHILIHITMVGDGWWRETYITFSSLLWLYVPVLLVLLICIYFYWGLLFYSTEKLCNIFFFSNNYDSLWVEVILCYCVFCLCVYFTLVLTSSSSSPLVVVVRVSG